MNISEFRKDISKHFNEAVQGRPVFIQRAGQMFKLEAYIPPEGGVVPKYTFSAPPLPAKKRTVKSFGEDTKNLGETITIPKINGVTTADKLPAPVKLCKIHDIPLDSRGRCLQKGCKYA